MPHIILKVIEGKSRDQLLGIAKGITKSFVDHGISEKAVTIRVEEFRRDDWMSEVYETDVRRGPGELLKGPEYDNV